MPKQLRAVKELREALSNLAWDCQSQWLDDDGVQTWSESQIEDTANNIIESLVEGKND